MQHWCFSLLLRRKLQSGSSGSVGNLFYLAREIDAELKVLVNNVDDIRVDFAMGLMNI